MSATPLADLTEKEWSDQLVGTEGKPGLARTLGWGPCYHTLRSKGSVSGFPDWVLVRERVVFLELKTETGKVSDSQRVWIQAMHRGGAEVYVVRPRHLEEIAAVLTYRNSAMPPMWRYDFPNFALSDELESVLQSR